MAGDVGFLPTLSYCGRIRGDFLNMTAMLCGKRFGRGLLCPGGTKLDVDDGVIADLLKRLASAHRDVRGAVDLSLNSDTVRARYDDCGTVSAGAARACGLVGVAARASGLARDARAHFPADGAEPDDIPLIKCESGDVFARAYVRSRELDSSAEFIQRALSSLPEGECAVPLPPLPPHRMAVGIIEGWRGEICHVALTNAEGRFAAYKIVDPSFHNWFGLALALRGQQISDFPLCNKSFNLSYCGHDL
jgi:Ni,Fe-hydrogenase III large subunit